MKEDWVRVKRINVYCDVCTKKGCKEWCDGELFEQSSVQIAKKGIKQRIIDWVLGNKE